ncbi:glycosyltransferase family 4 protein [Geodermatophilus sp. CPCC 206100]|uniref:glycosyltransferase family 4 protein n=1 Tax=Geodermatophilus sp. CPCC 206100 TaxID=3020054 RepID=UPI003AFFB3A9
MRVAIVSESFLPQVNGVTNSVLRICEQLSSHGHEALVIAPGPGPTAWRGVPVVRSPSCPVPGYKDFRVALPFSAMLPTLRAFEPDVVHLASPAVLGAQGASAATQLGVPCVAVYQTDLAAYAGRYGVGIAEAAVWRRLGRVHAAAARTLAPSRAAAEQLQAHGIERVVRWGRGVDLERFGPRRRDRSLRQEWSPDGQTVIGYVGRLAHEKELGLLAAVQDLPGVRLVVVGDGPQRRALERRLDRALFTGLLTGDRLAAAFASLDVFVHTGSHETFCQAAQEALASGVPVVAPAAGGLLDLVQPGVNGLLFAPGSAAGLADCVRTLQDRPDLRRHMGEQARKSVMGRTWAAVGEELVQHYRDVVAGARTSPDRAVA